MYEDSFGLKRRPFAATPDATCFLSASPVQGALDEILVCVEDGQGIAVLTAPAGTGKTLVCERLRSELDSRFETVFLRHSSFLTRRALLQTILCELNHAYHHPSEQELRLELFPAIRALQPKREALVLICDEAHQLTDSLIEELRILADFAESGRPLVRLVLVGQLSLEDKLAQPSLEAFNQRVRAHVSLPSFDRAGSKDYIDYRITWSGGRSDEVFTPDALNLIAHVSDGIPRCINQLADHTLLLAYVAEQRPAGEELVREALNDLRQLPLHWNEPSASLTTDHASSFESETSEDFDDRIEVQPQSDASGYLHHSASQFENLLETSNFEVGSPINSARSIDISMPSVETFAGYDTTRSADHFSVDIHSDEWKDAVDQFSYANRDRVSSTDHSLAAQESTKSSISGNDNQDLASHGSFADLVRDSYFAAQGLNPAGGMQYTLDVNQNSNISGPSHSSLSNDSISDRISTAIESNASTSPTTKFHEELIVDRYVSIDAGLKPIEISQADTVTTSEVQSNRDAVNNPIDTSAFGWSTSLRFDSNDFSELDTTADVGLKSKTSQKPVETDPIDRVLDSVHSLIDSVSDNIGHGNFDSYEIGKPNFINSSCERTQYDRVKADPVETDAGYRLADPSTEFGWESVETEHVEETPKSRPFRFLFSTLRRKQQGHA